MRQRTVTAVFFVLAMLGGVYGGPLAFYVLFLAIALGCLWEFYGLTLPQVSGFDRTRRLAATVVSATPYAVGGADAVGLAHLPDGTQWHFVVPLFLVAFVRPIVELFGRSERPFAHLGHMVFGMLYITWPFLLLTSIYHPADTPLPNRILGLLVLTWTNDTFAYLIGRKLGKTKLFERISPKKTWEGTLSGSVCTLLLAALLSQLFPLEFSVAEWMALGAVAAVMATVGDLVESMLKRSLGVKDSGTLLPGHGGLLDRFDALLFVVPFAWVVLMWLR
jgi:phosphatidate cytidylyltransferase